MKRWANNIAKRIAATTVSLLFVLFVSVMHAAALQPAQSHAMGGGMEQHGTKGAACLTLCNSTPVNKDEMVQVGAEEQDDDYEPPYITAQIDSSFLESLYPDSVPTKQPPPKIPLYKLNGVFLN